MSNHEQQEPNDQCAAASRHMAWETRVNPSWAAVSSPRLLWGREQPDTRSNLALCDETVTACVRSGPIQRHGCAECGQDTHTHRQRRYVVLMAPVQPASLPAERLSF
jgi:hypothetical protein